MDIVSKITSYARAVPAGLKAAGQELAKTASAVTGADISVSAPARPRRRKKTAHRSAATTKGAPKAKRATAKPPKAKRPAAKPKRRKARR